MPQINRIRVNNIKYNFGTQYYDDFMMRFSGRNTIYDLANGGGKSLLMLLLLQNMIPNCTLDDKQPIEKLFRGDSGNTAIHSLIEWNLDPCFRKDNFKYMLTGFCARKSGNPSVQEEDGLQDTGRGTASVEYFNYVIFYREFGENDIKNLPLSKDGVRITYQGLKDYLRALEKNAPGVSVKIFDRKGDYQSFIGNYGIYESEWEIIRGINRTEGHVRAYFETNYRTSRKVVEDLLIEEIIQKSFHNRLAVENDDDRMAQTLLDIKDKLVELSKKRAQINNYDLQAEALSDFAAGLSDFKNIYENKEKYRQRLALMLGAAQKRREQTGEENEKILAAIERISSESEQEHRLADTAEVAEQERSLAEVADLIRETQNERDVILREAEKLRGILTLKECIADYREFLEYKKQSDEIGQIIENRLRDNGDIINEMHILAAIRKKQDEEKRKLLEKSLEESRGLADSEEKQLAKLKGDETELAAGISKASGSADILRSEISYCEGELQKELQDGGVLVAEHAGAELLTLKEELAQREAELDRLGTDAALCEKKLHECRTKLNRVNALIDVNNETVGQMEDELEEEENSDKVMSDLKRVYGADSADGLVKLTEISLGRAGGQISGLEEQIGRIRAYMDSVERGTYYCDGEQYARVYEYLKKQYGDDAVTGEEWYASLNQGQKRDIYKRVPFIHYGFIIKNDFERIKDDAVLQDFGGSYAIPVISENVLYDMKLEVNTELVAFAAKNLSFLTDIGRVDNELKRCAEELEELESELERLRDREAVMREDHAIALKESVRISVSGMKLPQRLEEKRRELESLNVSRSRLAENESVLMQKQSVLAEEISSKKTLLNEAKAEITRLQRVAELDSRLQEYAARLKEAGDIAAHCRERLDSVQKEIEPVKSRYEAYRSKTASILALLDKIDTQWRIFAPYYAEDDRYADGFDPEGQGAYTEDELESRFAALRSIIEKDARDITDKETLRAHLFASMDKCRQSIEYRKMTLEAAAAALEADMTIQTDVGELLSIREKLSEYDKILALSEERLEAQRALYNRLDGSIAHGIHQIEQKYGSYTQLTCPDPVSFRKQHVILIEKLAQNKRKLSERQKAVQKEYSDLCIIIKDMERLVKNSGYNKTGEPVSDDTYREAVDFRNYESVQEEFEKTLRQELRRKDAFAKQKSALAARLRSLDAEELAKEFEKSLAAPENVEECERLEGQIKETNGYIRLEKERIARSTEDMERIKDSFENRCIQTCSNIKTELDRLEQLSTITMDGKVISIIGLQIPYLKEEIYKARMSSYIDETVTASESFKDAAGRLKYIRGRLTWKRLFSVIVSDMDSVRVNLYKRERIGDQSRYLRYEEAVGSTGQSQGIYIQFLIAVINYISNINMPAREAASTGKTIFIDNPFGAAKDIYIWEPIFKLLKANHVQLIVPARGVTPAITGRFDVNYILGQKLADNRQQTVVVDYHSLVENEGLEYERIDYEQQTLDLL